MKAIPCGRCGVHPAFCAPPPRGLLDEPPMPGPTGEVPTVHSWPVRDHKWGVPIHQGPTWWLVCGCGGLEWRPDLPEREHVDPTGRPRAVQYRDLVDAWNAGRFDHAALERQARERRRANGRGLGLYGVPSESGGMA